MKNPFKEWKRKIWQVGYEIGRFNGYDEGVHLGHKKGHDEGHKEGMNDGYQKGRDLEFRTMNTHLEAIYNQQMSQNVEWVVQRFREQIEKIESQNQMQKDAVVPEEVRLARLQREGLRVDIHERTRGTVIGSLTAETNLQKKV